MRPLWGLSRHADALWPPLLHTFLAINNRPSCSGESPSLKATWTSFNPLWTGSILRTSGSCVRRVSEPVRAGCRPSDHTPAHGGWGTAQGRHRADLLQDPTPLSPAGTHVGDAGVTIGIRTGETARSGPPCTLTPSPGGVTCPPCLSFPSLTARPPERTTLGGAETCHRLRPRGRVPWPWPALPPPPGAHLSCTTPFLVPPGSRYPPPSKLRQSRMPPSPLWTGWKWTAAELGGGGRSRGCARVFLFSVCTSAMCISAQDPL